MRTRPNATARTPATSPPASASPVSASLLRLADAPTGGTLEALATDPGSVADMAAFCRTTGNELIEFTKEGDVFRFVIKRA